MTKLIDCLEVQHKILVAQHVLRRAVQRHAISHAPARNPAPALPYHKVQLASAHDTARSINVHQFRDSSSDFMLPTVCGPTHATTGRYKQREPRTPSPIFNASRDHWRADGSPEGFHRSLKQCRVKASKSSLSLFLVVTWNGGPSSVVLDTHSRSSCGIPLPRPHQRVAAQIRACEIQSTSPVHRFRRFLRHDLAQRRRKATCA